MYILNVKWDKYFRDLFYFILISKTGILQGRYTSFKTENPVRLCWTSLSLKSMVVHWLAMHPCVASLLNCVSSTSWPQPTFSMLNAATQWRCLNMSVFQIWHDCYQVPYRSCAQWLKKKNTPPLFFPEASMFPQPTFISSCWPCSKFSLCGTDDRR